MYSTSRFSEHVEMRRWNVDGCLLLIV